MPGTLLLPVLIGSAFILLSDYVVQGDRDMQLYSSATNPVIDQIMASPPPASFADVDRAALDAAIANIGAQVRRCYRAPVKISAARQIVTVMQVRFGSDGMLLGMPLLTRQSGVTPEAAPYAGLMAEAARVAIIRCTPIAAPVELHQNGWEELYLTFSPKGSA